MDDLEYNFANNKIGISIKRPTGLREKWSEAYMELQCESCGSTDLTAETNGAGFAIACTDCPNYDSGIIERIAGYYDTEEAYIREPENFTEV